MGTWSYDFGEVTVKELASLKASDFSSGVESARDAAVSIIETGAVGKAENYRVVVRTDGGNPAGLSLEVRPNPTPTPAPPATPTPPPNQPAPPVVPNEDTEPEDVPEEDA